MVVLTVCSAIAVASTPAKSSSSKGKLLETLSDVHAQYIELAKSEAELKQAKSSISQRHVHVLLLGHDLHSGLHGACITVSTRGLRICKGQMSGVKMTSATGGCLRQIVWVYAGPMTQEGQGQQDYTL